MKPPEPTSRPTIQGLHTVDLVADQHYSVELAGNQHRVRLTDFEGHVLASSRASSGNREALRYVVKKSGSYGILVMARAANAGPYAL